MGYFDYGWRPYVPVWQRRAQAKAEMDALRKKGMDIQPVTLAGRKIASTFWGRAWCDHLESLSDYANRLPRGRTYVRNGSVCHLEINRGEVVARVFGSELYSVRIAIATLPAPKWERIKARCAGQIGSLLELLQGQLSDQVMQVVTNRTDGLFPMNREIALQCSCPDWAVMCKHVAAVLYGVGARLDKSPELLFRLRGVDHQELIAANAEEAVVAATARGKSRRLAGGDLADVFGIELETSISTGSTPVADAAPENAASVPTGRARKVNRRTKQSLPAAAVAEPSAARSTRKAASRTALTPPAAGEKPVSQNGGSGEPASYSSPGQNSTADVASPGKTGSRNAGSRRAEPRKTSAAKSASASATPDPATSESPTSTITADERAAIKAALQRAVEEAEAAGNERAATKKRGAASRRAVVKRKSPAAI